VTLRALLAKHPTRFYAQTWYADEAFLDEEPDHGAPLPRVLDCDGVPKASRYTAATLAALYLQHPTHPMWDRYLWTADMDRDDQRIYVGSVTNTGTFEIHRHIHLSDRFARPV